ncbi:MAG: PP2C family protein-serine/threonine phosphatase [Vicingaceae bacterium]
MKKRGDKASSRIKERNFKLNTLLEVSNAINNLESDEELFLHFQQILTEKLSLGKGLLISNISGWSVDVNFGNVPAFRLKDLVATCSDFNRISVLNDEQNVFLSNFDVLIPIFHKANILSYLLLGDFDGEKIEVSPIIRHLPFIQTLTNLIVVAQENKRLFDENLKQVALQRELELASEMQNMLIPVHIPERNDLDISALYQPHQIVGGDYYDFFKISKKKTVFCMADVSGKGISAALLMSNFQAMMHAILVYDHDLEKLAVSLNDRIFKNAGGEKFITAFISIFNHESRKLTYINAGHQPALLGLAGKVKLLTIGSPVLGGFEVLPHIELGQEKIQKGSTLMMFTDGVCEIENKKRKEFGVRGLTKVIKKNPGVSSKKMNDVLIKEIDKFREEEPYPDDLALMSVRFLT